MSVAAMSQEMLFFCFRNYQWHESNKEEVKKCVQSRNPNAVKGYACLVNSFKIYALTLNYLKSKLLKCFLLYFILFVKYHAPYEHSSMSLKAAFMTSYRVLPNC